MKALRQILIKHIQTALHGPQERIRKYIASWSWHVSTLSFKQQKVIAITTGIGVALFVSFQVAMSLDSTHSMITLPGQLSQPLSIDADISLTKDSLVNIGMMKALDSCNTTILSIAMNGEGQFVIAEVSESMSIIGSWSSISTTELERIEQDYVFISFTDSSSHSSRSHN
jgi:hypothetical protein